MARRTKKPAVSHQVYRVWLERFEEGESPPQIARSAEYDVRTVRKYIALLQQERELNQARAQVLRNALEQHYADLVAFAARLEGTVKGVSEGGYLERDSRLWNALKAHMPRSPLWKALDRWEHLKKRERQLFEAGQSRMEQKVRGLADLELAPVATGKEGIYRPGTAALVGRRLREAAEGRGSSPYVITTRPTGAGLVTILCDEPICAMVSPERVKEITAFFENLGTEIPTWPEVEELRRVLGELERITTVAEEELATIALRRVVPGRCRYCPF